jgi:hypothetical protein
VDVRIIAATNRPLEETVRHGRFRSDLFHRLNQVQLRVPPLRERPEDIVPLANHFLAKCFPDMRLSSDAVEILLNYSWPGNVRELRNVVVGAATLGERNEVRACDLPTEIFGAREAPAAEPANSPSEPTALDSIEKQTILRTLDRVGGHQGMAADQLGISSRTLRRKLKQYNLESATQPAIAPLGNLSGSEQQYFRARLDIPTQITMGDAQLSCKVLNVSAGGAALGGIREPLRLAHGFTIRFVLPGTDHTIESKGQLVWAEPQGRAGIRFLDLAPESQRRLTFWLAQKQKEEGWQIA